MKAILAIMTKEPVAGKVKTRLSPALSPGEATGLYDCFLQDRLAEMRSIPGVDKAIAYMPESAAPAFERYASDKYAIFPQRGQHLGERMHHIFSDKFKESYEIVIIIGCDSPDLPRSIVSNAFDILRSTTTDLVLGPATDGGYYLIGLKREFRELFTDINWGTDAVLSTTLEKANSIGIRSELLPSWSDIDTYQDLIHFCDRHKGPINNDHHHPAWRTLAYLQHIKKLERI